LFSLLYQPADSLLLPDKGKFTLVPDQRFLRSSISRRMSSISWRLASGVPYFGFSAC
jgi:hypothetical protein